MDLEMASFYTSPRSCRTNTAPSTILIQEVNMTYLIDSKDVKLTSEAKN